MSLDRKVREEINARLGRGSAQRDDVIRMLDDLRGYYTHEWSPDCATTASPGFSLSQRSVSNLVCVHPHLAELFRTAIRTTKIDFTIIEGRRTIERQRELVAAGKSWTMNSRHLRKVPADKGLKIPSDHQCWTNEQTGMAVFAHAVDVCPIDPETGKITWEWPLYDELADHIKALARTMDQPIEWGGDWKAGKRDGPHWQLPWNAYPVRD